jgi:hypothetical protein
MVIYIHICHAQRQISIFLHYMHVNTSNFGVHKNLMNIYANLLQIVNNLLSRVIYSEGCDEYRPNTKSPGNLSNIPTYTTKTRSYFSCVAHSHDKFFSRQRFNICINRRATNYDWSF